MHWEDLWYRRRWSLLSLLLWPLSLVYRLGNALHRLLTRSTRIEGLKIISVGNIVAGGSGKTPFVIFLAQWAKAAGLQVAVLSRGYGRQSDEILRFDSTSIPPVSRVGDEPALIARRCPGVDVWVGGDRIDVARRAKAHGAQVAILDDGFQHYRLARDLDIVLAGDFGNGRMLPAGPLREPTSALKRAHVVITRAAPLGDPGTRAPGQRTTEPQFAPATPSAITASWTIDGITDEVGATKSIDFIQGIPLVAVTGIARPSRFYEALTTLGAQLKATESFADHAELSDEDCRRIRALAVTHRARIITTEKDRERIGNRLDVLTTLYRVHLTSGETALAKTLGWPEALVPGKKH